MVDNEQLMLVPFGNDIISPSGEQRMEAFALIRISLPIRLAGLLGARMSVLLSWWITAWKAVFFLFFPKTL